MIGMPAVEAIYGNKLAPQFGDWYLSRSGFTGQPTEQPVPADRPNNLWEPVEGDFGAHGIFEDEAIESSRQLSLTTHRRQLGLVAGLAGVAFLVARRLKSKGDGFQVS